MFSIQMKSFIILPILLLSVSSADIDTKLLRCLVCRTLVDEFSSDISNVDPLKQVDIGQYRLDPKGNMLQKKVPIVKSEMHLTEMLEKVCERMKDYVRATYKSSGKLTLLKLISDGQLNPLMSEVDIIQDDDLNKSLEYFCTDIVNEHDEDVVQSILNEDKNLKGKICTETAGYCEAYLDGLEDGNEEEAQDVDDDEYNIKTEL